MTAFETVSGSEATFLRAIAMVYVHCVSKLDFPITAIGIKCVELVCRQIHCSFIRKLAERRVFRESDGHSVDTIFKGARSPALVAISSSSEIKVRWRYDIFLFVISSEPS